MKLKFLSFLVLFTAFSAVPAWAQTMRSMQVDLNIIKEEVEALQRAVYRTADSEKNDSSDAQLKIGQMDEVFRTTSGRIEELEYRIKTLEDRIEMINKDMDIRFRMLEERNGISSTAPVSSYQAPAQPMQQVSSQPVSSPFKAEDKVVPISEAISSSNVDTLYQRGLEAVKMKDNQTAISAFSRILSEYPDNKLAGNAQYWLGETYYVQKDYQRAAVAFAKGYEKYKNGSKGADCLLKLGMTMVELKKTPEACAAFVSLPKEFPKATQELKDRAASLAKKNSCR